MGFCFGGKSKKSTKTGTTGTVSTKESESATTSSSASTKPSFYKSHTKRPSLSTVSSLRRLSLSSRTQNDKATSSSAAKSMAAKHVASRDSFEMIKRRVKAPVSIFDRPMLTEVEFLIDPRYSSIKVIGTGSFGVVASAVDKETGDRVAIKKIMSAFSTSRSSRYVLREVRLLRHLNHPNIVRLLDLDVPLQYRAWDDVYIITPLLRTDLRSALNDNLLKTTYQKKKVAYDLMRALQYMHSLGLMHRDVKTRNILLNDDLTNAQLCDLGHSRFYSKTLANWHFDDEMNNEGKFDSEPDLTGAVTTMIQSAPEIVLGATYDETVDIWAAGCVIAEIVRPDSTLFNNTGKRSHIHEILEVVGFPSDEELSELPDHSAWFLRLKAPKGKEAEKKCSKIEERLGNEADEQVVDLLNRMIRFSPKERPSASEVLKHSWFDEVREERADCGEQYDFATSEPNRKATKSELKELVWHEVVSFNR